MKQSAATQASSIARRVCLASASPRRRDLLAVLGVEAIARPSQIDESRLANERLTDYALRMAHEKAQCGAMHADSRGLPVVAGDTIVCIDDLALGKPSDENDAIAMLSALSGREHQVLTSVAVMHAGQLQSQLVTTTVRFRTITEAEARAYWHSGEPKDKAGSYAIQGLGSMFVEHMSGSYSAVVGLPLFETAKLLGNIGMQLLAADERTGTLG